MPRVWTTKFLEADELTLKDQAKKYGTTAQAIVAANDVEWTKTAINDWVLEAGGKMLDSGWAVFQRDNQILLPLPVEETSPVINPPMAAQTKASGTSNKWLLAGMVGGLLLLAYKNEKRNR